MKTKQELLQALAKQNGGILTAEAVVAAARPEESPLHDSFEWDDSEASRLWRLHQARNIILKIKVEMQGGSDGDPLTVRVWSSLTPDRENEGGGYRQTVAIMKNKDMRAQLLEDAFYEMERFAEKYRCLSELAEVFMAIKRARKGA